MPVLLWYEARLGGEREERQREIPVQGAAAGRERKTRASKARPASNGCLLSLYSLSSLSAAREGELEQWSVCAAVAVHFLRL
jgi:hypothetical protein